MEPIVLEVAYSQISVFRSCLGEPFNDWTDRHVAQGFSWRPGSVSFRTLEHEGPISVTVEKGSSLEVSPSARRAIRVPFHMPKAGAVEIGTIVDTVKIELDSGDYTLLFEHGVDDDSRMWCRFRFLPGSTTPGILRADDELHPGDELLMDARPAAP